MNSQLRVDMLHVGSDRVLGKNELVANIRLRPAATKIAQHLLLAQGKPELIRKLGASRIDFLFMREGSVLVAKRATLFGAPAEDCPSSSRKAPARERETAVRNSSAPTVSRAVPNAGKRARVEAEDDPGGWLSVRASSTWEHASTHISTKASANMPSGSILTESMARAPATFPTSTPSCIEPRHSPAAPYASAIRRFTMATRHRSEMACIAVSAMDKIVEEAIGIARPSPTERTPRQPSAKARANETAP